MTNYTLTIKSATISDQHLNHERNFARGFLHWNDGTIEFKKKFRSFSITVVDFLEANKTAGIEFTVVGSLTKREGTNDWKGKWFEEIIITEIKLAK
jgi:hypothetical protein